MSDIIILIDDEPAFVDSFNLKVQKNGFKLVAGKSLEGLKRELAKFEHRTVAVILDVKCLLNDEQEIESPDFIGAAINFMNQNYPHIPRLILTGDDKAINGVRYIFNADTEDIYSKNLKDIDNMFLKIEDHKKKFPQRKFDSDTKEIIALLEQDESKKLEFKSSLRYSVRDKIRDDSLQFQTLKNLAAFFNTNGGVLLIGVEDDKTIIGLENTDYLTFNGPNKLDSFKLQLDNLIESNFDNTLHRIIDVSVVKINDKSVCKIKIVSKSPKPIFIKKREINTKGYNAFFIRRIGSAKELKDEEKDEYIKQHWPENN